MRTQEQREEQTLVITSMVLGPALIWTAPFLVVAILLLAGGDLGPLPAYPVLLAAYAAVLVARLLTRRRR